MGRPMTRGYKRRMEELDRKVANCLFQKRIEVQKRRAERVVDGRIVKKPTKETDIPVLPSIMTVNFDLKTPLQSHHLKPRVIVHKFQRKEREEMPSVKAGLSSIFSGNLHSSGQDEGEEEIESDQKKLILEAVNRFKLCELRFEVVMYLSMQPELNEDMRSTLVDWMAGVHRSRTMNDIVIFAAVKLVDFYLGKAFVKWQDLMTLGATALWVAAKFDRRIHRHWLRECDNVLILSEHCTKEDVLRMEMNILNALHCDLEFPLSYTFLMELGQCGRICEVVLTLARYCLEMCLMEYEMITTRDSLMAAAALYLALKIKAASPDEVVWTPTLELCSGYQRGDLSVMADRIVNIMRRRSKPTHVGSIKTKYLTCRNLEVAMIPIPEELYL